MPSPSMWPRSSDAVHYGLSPMGLAAVMIALLLAGCNRQGDAIVSIALHPTNPRILYVSTNESVYKTRDGGDTWARMATDLSSYRILSLAIDPLHPATVYAGTMMDAVYKSPDGGQHWMPHNVGLKEHISVVNQFIFHPQDTERIYAATTVGVFYSDDGGRTWTERMHGMKEVHIVIALAMDPQRADTLYAGTTGGVYRTFDGGAVWRKINRGLIPDDLLDASLALGINVLAVDPTRGATVYAGTTKGLYKSNDAGEHWERIGADALADQYISSFMIDPRDSNRLYAGGRAGIERSLDGGTTWRSVNDGLGSLNIRTLALSPLDSQLVYAGTNGSGLYRSRNGGEQWSAITLRVAPESPNPA
jgi:photosystem II stability/assembly factor-like uncharacterized protein